ncbi:DMT family transporter [Lapillicoccus sp.]|uniref:DMT family transporter n=1 Tax=Lapillicoccus sp. TaxID=1909287 RepID=UPI0039836719
MSRAGLGSRPHGVLRVGLLAALAMTAFAANSVLARLALDGGGIDPGTFTVIRLSAGASVLVLIVRASARADRRRWAGAGSWPSAALLLTYAGAFSFAYVSLGAATGALVLFGVVQTVMFTAALRSGERPGVAGWSGLALAVAGLVLLVAPGVSRPDPVGALLMALAGVAWAGYTLRGRGAGHPVLVTAGNFLRSVPMALAVGVPVLLLHREGVHIGQQGAVLAVLSGAVASGLGYVLWYTVLPWLTRVQTGIVQLAPAPLAAIGGLAVLAEPLTSRVLLASLLILGGVLIGMWRPRGRT